MSLITLPPYKLDAAADPYWSSTSLLLHMDGANASTTFADSSSLALNATALVAASVDTSASKFGGASGNFNGASALSLPTSSALAMGTGDFTLEFWLNSRTVIDNYRRLVTSTNGGFTGTSFTMRFNAGGVLYVGNISYAWTISTGTWYSVAYVRHSGVGTLYINGVAVATAADTTNYDQFRYIGGWYTSGFAEYFDGHLDELRITKGVARYTANYSVATSAFSNG